MQRHDVRRVIERVCRCSHAWIGRQLRSSKAVIFLVGFGRGSPDRSSASGSARSPSPHLCDRQCSGRIARRGLYRMTVRRIAAVIGSLSIEITGLSLPLLPREGSTSSPDSQSSSSCPLDRPLAPGHPARQTRLIAAAYSTHLGDSSMCREM